MRKEHVYFVYIMSNKSRRLHTGVTHSIHRRAYELILLLLAKRDQGLARAKKLALILAENPLWADLSKGWYPQDEAPLPPAR